ncbi:hypothetical protein ONS95_012174 [Cadophora gregata]|uniref:uncharacterized protein n=1 Tax=Cadophora gregata TaxID=51156 RepID=UPI0026DCEA24|nr:uncharacterized protein ONS95_012174 [Cadophora gregata]KAK0117853.1 hypothetical protein ONS95_012174 [Cadophora gregata]
MDDPWGSSPWADEAQLSDSVKTKADTEGTPRPTTPVRAPKLGLDDRITSPWGDNNDNDGFGDWATLPGDSGQNLALDGADDSWDPHSARTGDMKTGHYNALSTEWDFHHPTDSDKSPSLAPDPFPRSPELMRQPSLDPWAQEIPEEHNVEVKEAPEAHDEEARINVTLLENESAGGPETPTIQSSIETMPDLESDNVESVTTGGDIPGEASETKDHDLKDSKEKTSEGNPGSESQESDPVSRPSSSPSERSHHDELPQESPRTSFDEEPKPNRPQIPRKVSTKVQELVQHFDTLAKKEDFEPIIVRATSAQGTNMQEDSEEDDDFGDFEEGQSDDDVPEVEESRRSEQSLTQTSVKETSRHQRSPSLENALTKDYGVVVFNIDPSQLDGLYPSDTPDSTSGAIFIPDSIPFDSFSSTEQRKTWYRISRYGTMRKHNGGNDENYVRVGWKPSTIRDDTLKIVSRWIEEDRISGRVVLGGGSKGSTVFGWNDPKSPAVPLSDVFVKHGKKMTNANNSVEALPEVPREWPKGLVRERSTSKTRSPSSKPRRKSSVKAASMPMHFDMKNTPVASVATFGWNSTSGAAQPPSTTSTSSGTRTSGVLSGSIPHINTASPRQKSRSPNASFTYPPQNLNSASHVTNILAATSVESEAPHTQKNVSPPALSTSNAVIDDDDWGEMVSTPATPNLPSLPALKGLHHKQSQSRGETVGDFPQGGILSGRIDGPQATNHRPTNSFDEILVPQPSAPALMNPSIVSNVDFFSPPRNSIESPAAVSTSDPWASADFSFFETTPASAPKLVPILMSTATGPKSVKFNTPLPSSPRRDHKSREELEQDRMVQKVVKGLPDLSYMLRK